MPPQQYEAGSHSKQCPWGRPGQCSQKMLYVDTKVRLGAGNTLLVVEEEELELQG